MLIGTFPLKALGLDSTLLSQRRIIDIDIINDPVPVKVRVIIAFYQAAF